MPAPRIMFCGASDTGNYFPIYYDVVNKLNFSPPINFINGEYNSDNFRGPESFVKNSVASIDDSDIVVFVIKEKIGEITWDTEYSHVINEGKNYLVFVHEKLNERFRAAGYSDIKNDPAFTKLYELEHFNVAGQVTLQVFNESNFKHRLETEISNLIREALSAKQSDNAKKRFIHQHLTGPKFNQYEESELNDFNSKICYRILFDPFEDKELRKRAMEFFTFKKILNTDDIKKLCLDYEQGISRKAIQFIYKLIDRNKIDLDEIFEEVITAIANDSDVGLIRRAIKAFGELDLILSIKYFGLFFPAEDVGTPKRIIRLLQNNIDVLKDYCKQNNSFVNQIIQLVDLCLDREAGKGEWKKVAETIKEQLSQK